MKTRRCPVCGSDKILIWLGGSIGTLYHCSECEYVGPVVIEGDEWNSSGTDPKTIGDEFEGRIAQRQVNTLSTETELQG